MSTESAGKQAVTPIVSQTQNRTAKIENPVKKLFNNSRFSEAAQDLADTYGEFKNSASGALDSINDFTSVIGDSAEAIMGAASTGVFETVTFPKNFSRELCLRLDFIEYDRKNRFQTSKVYPKACIILPLPQNLSFGQGVNYNFSELGLVGQLESQLRGGEFGDIEQTVRGVGQAVSTGASVTSNQGVIAGIKAGLGKLQDVVSESSTVGAVKSAGAVAGLRLLQSAGNVGIPGFEGADSAITANLGVIANPHLANIFQGIQPRTFSFRMVLQVSSQDESLALQDVIHKLRKFYLPALSADKTALSYPHEVNVSFSEGGYSSNSPKTPLDNLFRFKRCVLENVGVEIGSDGTPAFFHNLEPTAATLDLTFREVEITTANDFGLEAGKGIIEAFKDSDALQSIAAVGENFEKRVSPLIAGKQYKSKDVLDQNTYQELLKDTGADQ